MFSDAFEPTSKPVFQSFGPNNVATHVAEAIVPKDKSIPLISKIRETLPDANIGKM